MDTPQLENGHTRIANEILEALCRLKCSNYETRLLYALFRKTYGYHKKEDFISLTQFEELTGISSQHIARAKKKLLERKVIYTNGRKVGFNKALHDWVVPNEVVPKQVTGSTQTGSKTVPKQVLTKERKKLIQKKYTSLKDLDETVFKEIAEQYSVSVNIVSKKKEALELWCESNNKKYKNYKAALQNWIRRDLEAGKIQKVTPAFKPDLPEISEEQRLMNIEIVRKMKARVGL